MNYSYDQSHGKRYEDYLKGAFPGASDFYRSTNSLWDIERKFDKLKYLPTQIKTTGSNIVCLASAPKFWTIKEKFRILVGQYEQLSNIKKFYILHEFIFTESNLKQLRGNITENEILNIDNYIKSFKRGEHFIARDWAHNKIKQLQNSLLLTLNPKTDSKIQRRLQCSASINILKDNCEQYNIYTEFYRNFGIGFQIRSGSRYLK